MRFTPTEVDGVFVVDVEPHADERGSLARAYCAEELAAHGLEADVAQMNLNHSVRAGTLRGLHFQHAPHGEAKLVRCVRGAVFDVAADVRPDSPTYGRWVGVELTADNRRALFVPAGCAHGFQTLVDDTELLYTASHPYTPGAEGGVHHADPMFEIPWPLPVASVSDKDASWPHVPSADTTG
ncbi:dTDP-4-dehydrorhamnose 3,5-epimerase [Egicoccus halophilus]|uniref:dTDP-4-dehydrorhamnose 3,5-epimerase n=1 Tax=Egicoccus halophilus TaxID=1670830 RepID=A0A8J3A7A6_9ACTN|nr:dTDP-4-dehydrorhamnose 3,5-epimerase [Egicoccus halophilus]GGI05368.1 dTDP-4-dehydrorhamnose 3,5-epimerase [Egicoccus halophilus]